MTARSAEPDHSGTLGPPVGHLAHTGRHHNSASESHASDQQILLAAYDAHAKASGLRQWPAHNELTEHREPSQPVRAAGSLNPLCLHLASHALHHASMDARGFTDDLSGDSLLTDLERFERSRLLFPGWTQGTQLEQEVRAHFSALCMYVRELTILRVSKQENRGRPPLTRPGDPLPDPLPRPEYPPSAGHRPRSGNRYQGGTLSTFHQAHSHRLRQCPGPLASVEQRRKLLGPQRVP